MGEVFSLTMPIWEIGLRATIVYLGLVLLVRFVPQRNAGHISPNDLLTLIVVGGVATDAIMGGSDSVGDSLLLISIILLWAFVLDALEYHFPILSPLLRHADKTLIDDGRLNRRNMRRELITEEELQSALRKAGVDEPSEVASARIEADGEISVIARRSGGREGSG